MPYRIWTTGQLVTAADFNDYLQEQVIPIFTDAATRNAQITNPIAGQHAYLTGIGALTVYTGSAWAGATPAIHAVERTITVTNANIGTQSGVAFPAGLFASPPMVVVQPTGTSAYIGFTPVQATTASVSVNVRHINDVAQSASIPVSVIAIGVRGGVT